MDFTPQTYALLVPDGVVTYNLCPVYDDAMQHVGTYPADGRLHRKGDRPSVTLERAVIEHYIAQYGIGSHLHARL